MSARRPEEQVRSAHELAHEELFGDGPGRVFCSCEWSSEVAPAAERIPLWERHVDHEVNAEEWCFGDPEKAEARYWEIERRGASA